ncbi:MAG: replication-associated recombination protein A [Pseudobdellovibrionaceae bacterium]
MDLFNHANTQNPDAQTPLAEKLRPRTLEQMLGQPKIVGTHSPWRKLLTSGKIPSLILWGPPGCGKTTFALLLGQYLKAQVDLENAIDLGAKALRELGEAARNRRLGYSQATLLFIDEIHRLNKSQQDVLLPYVERGDLTLVGATTENPSYELNAALLSRCRVLVSERLSESDLLSLVDRAMQMSSAKKREVLTPESEKSLLTLADGDARRLLNLLEVIIDFYKIETSGISEISWPLNPETLSEILDRPSLRYDKSADEHYDCISAFIKSIRGSDPDAALYYLARMIKGGEDPVFIARRLVVLASEDIGNADPRALSLAVAGLQAVELVGWPEGRINLAQVVTYLASAPKSNRSYMALNKAQEIVEQTGTLPVPLALRSAKTKTMKELGYGKGYLYSHEGERGYLPQQFLPDQIKDIKLYEPTDHGFEKNITQYLAWLRGER